MTKTAKPATLQTSDPELETIYPRRAKAPVTSFELEPLTPEEKGHIHAQKQVFEERFPPLALDRNDVLVVSWAEIERQFLDLCAPWDQQGPAYEIRKAAQISRHETPEQTIRWLFTLARAATDIDTPEPRWGSGGLHTDALSPAGLVVAVVAGATGLSVMFVLLAQCLVMIQAFLTQT